MVPPTCTPAASCDRGVSNVVAVVISCQQCHALSVELQSVLQDLFGLVTCTLSSAQNIMGHCGDQAGSTFQACAINHGIAVVHGPCSQAG